MHIARNFGRSNDMMLSIIPRLLEGERIGILGCKDPKDIINKLDEYGVLDKLKKSNLEIKYEPMLVKPKLQPIYTEEGKETFISDFKNDEGKQVGYCFFV